MLSIRHLGLVLLLLVSSSLDLGRVELTEVSLVVIETLRVLMDDVGSDVVEESSVVRAGMSAGERRSRTRVAYTTRMVPCQVWR